MCGRYSFSDTDRLYERFNVEQGSEQLKDRYNVSPGTKMPAIVGEDDPHVEILEWGLRPPWLKEKGRALINARAETLATKRTFKKLFESGRCLIPATGYFEWQKTKQGKTPYWHHRKDGDLFAFAGLCDDQHFTIVTTDAHPGLQKIHDRMPVILKPEYEDDWLNPDLVEPKQVQALLEPVGMRQLEVYEVSKEANAARHRGPNLIAPAS